MSDRNEWFKEAKETLRHLEIEAVENPFAWPTSSTDRSQTR